MSGLSIDDTPPDGIETVYVPEEPYEPPKPAYAPLFNPTKFQEHPVPVLETATPSDIDGISMLIARCFAELDASRWLANNDEQWLNRRFWQFFRHVYARPALLAGRGLVHHTADHSAAAIWLHVEPYHDTENSAESTNELRRITGEHYDRFALFEQMLNKAHDPYRTQSHDYLGVVAVRPGRRRQGIASALVRTHLRRLDDEGRPAYLEAADALRAEIWGKLGFEIVDSFTLPDGTEMFPMWRTPRSPEQS